MNGRNGQEESQEEKRKRTQVKKRLYDICI